MFYASKMFMKLAPGDGENDDGAGRNQPSVIVAHQETDHRSEDCFHDNALQDCLQTGELPMDCSGEREYCFRTLEKDVDICGCSMTPSIAMFRWQRESVANFIKLVSYGCKIWSWQKMNFTKPWKH
jgi:hypothetical protein